MAWYNPADWAASAANFVKSIFGRLGRRAPRGSDRAGAWRKLSPGELERLGYSRKSKRYAPADVKRPTKRTATLSEKAVRNLRALEETGTPLKGSEGPTREATGRAKYTSASVEDIAGKQQRTAQRKREERILKTRLADVETVRHPGGSRTTSYFYRTAEDVKSRYLELRQRKLAGGWLEDGDWHSMMDIAAAINDPELRALRVSPEIVEI